MATDGVYLGIPPKILSALKDGHVMQAFGGKGRLSPLIASIPVSVTMNSKYALLGATQYGLDSWKKQSGTS